MPLDHKGGFHMNPQVARMHDAARPVHAKPEADKDAGDQEHGHPAIHHIEIHPHGDGTHHTVTHHHPGHPAHKPEGTRADHGSLDEAMDHMHAQMNEDGQEHEEPDGDEAADTGAEDVEY